MHLSGLADPPQGSYAALDLALLAVELYWPSLLLSLVLPLFVGEVKDRRLRRRPPPLAALLPLLVWAWQSHQDLHGEWVFGWAGPPAYFLWHRLAVAYCALAAIVGILSILLPMAAWRKGWAVSWPSPVWSLAVVLAPLADWLVLIFFSSPLEAVWGR